MEDEATGDPHLLLTCTLIYIVLFFYAKNAGKNSPHGLVTEEQVTNNLSGLSNIAFQIFEHSFAGQFTSITQATATLNVSEFSLLAP